MAGTASNGIDFSDVPRAAADDLALAIRVMIEAERALMLVRGATRADRAEIEAAFWQEFEGDTAAGVATLIRFWSLVDAFQSRRLRGLFMQRGYELLGPAVKAAASLRLNLDWGFNPQRLIWAIGPVQPAAVRLLNPQRSSNADEVGMAA